MAVTGATRGEIQGLLNGQVVQQGQPRDGSPYRWSRDEIVMLTVALRLTRMGVLMVCVRKAINAVRREYQAGELGSMVFRFDDTGRIASAGRSSPTDPSEGASGSRLLIDVAAEARTIDAKLRQYRADHGVAPRGPKTHRKTASGIRCPGNWLGTCRGSFNKRTSM